MKKYLSKTLVKLGAVITLVVAALTTSLVLVLKSGPTNNRPDLMDLMQRKAYAIYLGYKPGLFCFKVLKEKITVLDGPPPPGVKLCEPIASFLNVGRDTADAPRFDTLGQPWINQNVVIKAVEGGYLLLHIEDDR